MGSLEVSGGCYTCNKYFVLIFIKVNLLAPELFFFILAHLYIKCE